MFLGAYLNFALSQLLGLSGIVSLFFFGVVLSHYNWYNLSESSKVASTVTFVTLAKLAEAVVFIYLGIVASLSVGRFHWHAGLVVVTVLLITVARAAHVLPLSVLLNFSRGRKIDRNMMVAMWVSGLRGAIAFALSLRIPCQAGHVMKRGSPQCRNSDLLVTTTISIVVLTTMVVGTAMERIATALRVIEPCTAHLGAHLGSPTSPLSQGSLSEPLQGYEELPADSQEGAAIGRRGSTGSSNSASSASHETPSCMADPFSFTAFIMPSLPRRATLWSLRFNARGSLYQAFARFDLDVLQPALGGPCRSRLPEESLELPRRPLGPLGPRPLEEDVPSSSRSVIFE